MGANQSDSFNADLASYKIIEKIPQHNITYLSHNETDKEYLLRELTFNDENIYKKNKHQLEKRQSVQNQHLTHLGRVQGKTIDHLCSNVYKIYAMWEYPQRYLSSEINERALQRRKFQQKQLWSILASLILGMSTLQKNKIKHECLNTKNILLDNEGLVKVADPLAAGTTTNIDIIYNNRHARSIYLSPEQCQSLQVRSVYSNPYKNDVWSMGMILLQCGLLQRQDDCYKDEYQRIDHDLLNKNIRRFGLQYSEELRIITQLMLKRDNKDRPDWLDLQQYARKSSDKSQIINQSAQKNQRVDTKSFSPIYNYDHFKPSNTLNSVPNQQETKRDSLQKVNQLNFGTYHPPANTHLPQTVRSQTYYQQSIPQPQLQPNYNPVNRNTQVTFAPSPSPNYHLSYQQSLNSYNTNFQEPKRQKMSPPKTYPVQQMPQQNYLTSNTGYLFSNPTGSIPSTHQTTFPNPPISQSYKSSQPLYPNHLSSPPQTYPKKPDNLIQNIQPQTQYQPTQTSMNYTSIANQNKNGLGQPKNEFQFKTFGKTQINAPRPASNIEVPYKPLNLNVQNEVPITTSQIQFASQKSPSKDLQFVIQTFKQGSRYEGYKLHDMRHGQGKFYYQDGGMYDGSWNQNKMDGFGSLFYQSGTLAYQGMWKSDQFQGKGKLFNESSEKLNSLFDYTNFDEIDEYWEYYEGDFIEDMKKGKGKLMLSNGEYFIGTFENDMVEGPGQFYRKDGSVISGQWQSNQYISS